MPLARKIGALLDIMRCYVHHPTPTRISLLNLPKTVRGFRLCQDWENGNGDQVPPTDLDHETSNGPSNPLRSYFDANKEDKGIWKWLHYFDIYHRHFSKFVGREVHVLEVGIYGGGSLEMWREYFGPRCSVYGVDIQEKCKVFENEYTKVFIGDQENREFWRDLKGQVPTIDILIDDGGHKLEQQIATLEEMLPHLRPGGVYLCEDVEGVYNGFTAYAQGLIENLNSRESKDVSGTASTQFQAAIHSIHHYPYVIVIERTDKPVDRFHSIKRGTDWQPWLR